MNPIHRPAMPLLHSPDRPLGADSGSFRLADDPNGRRTGTEEPLIDRVAATSITRLRRQRSTVPADTFVNAAWSSASAATSSIEGEVVAQDVVVILGSAGP